MILSVAVFCPPWACAGEAACPATIVRSLLLPTCLPARRASKRRKKKRKKKGGVGVCPPPSSSFPLLFRRYNSHRTRPRRQDQASSHAAICRKITAQGRNKEKERGGVGGLPAWLGLVACRPGVRVRSGPSLMRAPPRALPGGRPPGGGPPQPREEREKGGRSAKTSHFSWPRCESCLRGRVSSSGRIGRPTDRCYSRPSLCPGS
jgi:hypothetical protein